jgi:hypothetical protein
MSFVTRQCGGWRAALRAGGAVAAVLGAVAGAAAWLGVARAPLPVVSAGERAGFDSDGDGLHDALELVMGLNSARFDTDGDGFGDGEEVARRTNPHRNTLFPSSAEISVSMDAYAANGRVHAMTAVYLPSGSGVNPRDIRFGVELGGQLRLIPRNQLRGGEPASLIPLMCGASLVVFDPVLPEAVVQARGGISMFAVVTVNGTVVAADALNVRASGGQLFERVDRFGPGGDATPVGSIYRPLTSGGPSSGVTQNPGQICAQKTAVLAVIGALVTEEVIEAECIDGWDAYCSPGCAATVGSTLKKIDPAALIGG